MTLTDEENVIYRILNKFAPAIEKSEITATKALARKIGQAIVNAADRTSSEQK